MLRRRGRGGRRRLGAAILITLTATYVIGGLTGILVGHDILDAMLMAYLAVGAYLAAGTSMLPEEAADPQRPGN